ncbi:MAG: tetratricopeptide repeat protein, partial [Acidobacteria bacterium]|nr:tetratricopeptide repeat protein [Acidobacteriota bacterium]
QLIKVSDGFHLWSETYDREVTDIFAVQDEIARSVAGEMKVTLLGGNRPSARSANPEAYSSLLQGRYFHERQTKEDLEKAVGYYQQALKLDSGYARAWAWLGLAYSDQAGGGFVPTEEGYRKARPAIEQALKLDENLALAHTAMGFLQRDHDWDWSAAEASFQRAVSLEPRNEGGLVGLAALALTLGRFEEALTLSRRAVELDPLNFYALERHADAAEGAGRLDEAVAVRKKILELNSEYPGGRAFLGGIYLLQSRPQEALAEIEREKHPVWQLFGLALAHHALGRKKESNAALAQLIKKYPAEAGYQIAEVYAFRGEADPAFEWLERAYVQRDPGLAWVKGDPFLKSLKGDPRWAAFLRKMRLPE